MDSSRKTLFLRFFLLCKGIIGRQFNHLKFGDRFYYENGDSEITRFTLDQLDEIRHYSLAKLYCENLGLEFVQKFVLLQQDPMLNPFVLCKEIPDINFKLWSDKPEYDQIENTHDKKDMHAEKYVAEEKSPRYREHPMEETVKKHEKKQETMKPEKEEKSERNDYKKSYAPKHQQSKASHDDENAEKFNYKL